MKAVSYKLCLVALIWALGFSLAGAEEEEPLFEVNFVDTDLGEFINSVSRITATTFIVDPRVKGQVTVRTVDRLSADAIYDIFLAQLRAQGFATVDLPNGNVKIVPDQSARLEPVPVENSRPQGKGSSSDGVATRVYSVRDAASEQLLNILKPLIDPRVGVITPYPSANLLIVTDWRSNLDRIDSLLRNLDQVSDDPLEALPLVHASANDTAQLMTRLLAREGVESAQVIADPRSNALLVRGSADSRARVRKLLKQLDVPQGASRGSNTQVVYLRHASAVEVVKVLRGLSQDSASAPAGTPEEGKPVAQRSDNSGIQLESEEGTNAVVMVGPDSELAAYRNIIEQLDIRRAQVMVEAIIAEISETRAKELGVQWLFLNNGNNMVPVGSISNGGAGGINNLAGAVATGNEAALTKALAGIQGATAGIGNLSGGGLNFVALLNALKSESGFNLLSTPTLLTLDNAEASILVGQEVPFVTGSVTQNNSNPYQTIERKEVGVKLRIKPQINIDNTVRLDIVQEVSSIADRAGTGASDVITNKREIKTKVMVEDNGLVVLGGLIGDEVNSSHQGVPWLSDIPGLGKLFQSNSKRQTKQNLMIFIRPKIIRDPQTLAQLSSEKYRNLKQTTPLALPALSDANSLLQLFPASRERMDASGW